MSSKILRNESCLQTPFLVQDEEDNTAPITKVLIKDEPKSIQAKWLDYLNSFQEATPDVDQQMEEFVRVPSQVEALLSFGIIICIDCYLYTVTILPLRAIWSVVLLGIRWTKPIKAEYQFHRR